MIIETREPGKHTITLSNGAKLEVHEAVEGRIRITNCTAYVRLAVDQMGNGVVSIIARKEEPNA